MFYPLSYGLKMERFRRSAQNQLFRRLNCCLDWRAACPPLTE
ncbi:hypothetical protein CLOSTASPAR_02222 [[Clostridium] asparagiforme DSM 15981]|uniref:Uncharacterized protein n=1 Tax=[Clostridium] asparagiforme DSM 15981 TaxID=518636 RepID=C0CYZ4_9FIRM|nr:hypothetical protein CLOSTASPAR_02222 [[Clostridium] asparagiforme DSM 15981]